MKDRERQNQEMPFSKGDYEDLAAFRYALRRFQHFSDQAAQAVGLTPQQHQALLAVIGFPGRDHVTIGELAERLQIRPHSAVGLVDRLACQGLAERQSPTGDRRQVFVALTPQGQQILDALTAVHREELHRLGPEIRLFLEQLAGKPGTGDGAVS